MLPEAKRDWIMDLHNAGGYEVYSKNTGDEDDCADWWPVTMGMIACYILGEVQIMKYRKRELYE